MKIGLASLAEIWNELFAAGATANGQKIRYLSNGAIMGSRRGNEVIRALNALLSWKVQMVDGQTPSITIADAGVSLSIPRGQAQPGTTTGGIQYLGEYDAGTDYVADDLVYTNDLGDRIPWICEIANGPSTTVQAPTWTEPGTVYWRCLAHFEAGGAVTLYTVITVDMAGNYLVCRPDGGAGDGSDDINVAIQPELRNTIASQVIDGETWNYSYSGQSRTATLSGGSYAETEEITPRFLEGDVVPVTRCTNTGVTVGGVGLQYISITGREWAKIPDEAP